MAFKPRAEIPHKNGDPFSCGCRKCSDRRQDRLQAEDDGLDWRNDEALKLDREERSILADAQEEQRKFNVEFDARMDATIEHELKRSREQYERDERDRVACEVASSLR